MHSAVRCDCQQSYACLSLTVDTPSGTSIWMLDLAHTGGTGGHVEVSRHRQPLGREPVSSKEPPSVESHARSQAGHEQDVVLTSVEFEGGPPLRVLL